jgi:hypothetical protein
VNVLLAETNDQKHIPRTTYLGDGSNMNSSHAFQPTFKQYYGT